MDFTYEELETIIRRISSGKEYISIGNFEFISVIYPTNEIKYKSDLVYKEAYDKAIEEGLLPLDKLESLIEERGLFTEDDKTKLDKLNNKLEAQKVLLSKTLKVKANQERIKKVIKDLEYQINEIMYKKYSKLTMSAESKAEEVRTNYMCWLCTLLDDGSLYWPTFSEFSNDVSDIKSKVIDSFSSILRGYDVSTIRYVARNTLWRIRYTNSLKISDPLFDRASTEYTIDQLNLTYWSNFYEQVYSMLPEDRPSDEVINDDALLDAYMDEYYKELSNDASIRRSNKSKSRGAMSAFDAEEVIVTQSNELYTEIEYDKPREAQRIKDRADIKKRTVSSK